MTRIRSIIFITLFAAIAILSACSKDSNPAVPSAPEGDVISNIEGNPLVRVGLLSFSPQKHLYISSTSGEFKCYVGESLQTFADGIAGEILKFTGTDNMIEFTPKGSDEPRPLHNIMIRIEPADNTEDGYLMIGPSRSSIRPYRGTLRIILEGKNLLAVNEVVLEDYLLGVVPAEMDPEWPEEALICQAIVSRTFAIFNLGHNINRGFDLADDDRGQKYGGVIVETASGTNAVVETTNQVLTFNGDLAVVVFHSESGGQTASNLDVWPYSGEVPYLAGVSDVLGVTDFSAGGMYDSWTSWASFSQLRDAFNLDGETFVGSYLSSLTILGRSENGRVQSVDISGEKNPVVSATTFMNTLNRRLEEDFLPSNKFTISLEGEGYRFTGSGKGHGVGMSKWGVYQRSINLQGHGLILSRYFPGCEITDIPLEGVRVVHNTKVNTIRF